MVGMLLVQLAVMVATAIQVAFDYGEKRMLAFRQ
jgi:hypothetical protein